MRTFPLTDETAINVLIFFVGGSDGSTSYEEQEAVKRALNNMEYSMKTYRETLSHLGALSTEDLHKVEDEAIRYANTNFSQKAKKLVFTLLEAIADSEGGISKEEQKKLDIIKSRIGV